MRQYTIKLVFLFFWLFAAITAFSQESPPPPGEHGSGTNQAPGGGAPVDGGPLTLTLMAAGYAVYKWYRNPPLNQA
jgi:hypothetical protein